MATPVQSHAEAVVALGQVKVCEFPLFMEVFNACTGAQVSDKDLRGAFSTIAEHAQLAEVVNYFNFGEACF